MYKILDLSTGNYIDGVILYTKEDCDNILNHLYYSNNMNKHFILSEEASVFFNVSTDLVRVNKSSYLIETIPDN